MGPMHLMVFLLLGLFHSSLARACVGCPYNVDVNDPTANLRLRSRLQHSAPNGLATNEMVELVRIKELKEQVVAGFIYSYDFEARGLKSNSLYDCKFVIFEQTWLHREEVKEYRCRVVPSHNQERSESTSDLQEPKPIIGGVVGGKAPLGRACVGCPYNVDVNDRAANQRLRSRLQHSAPTGLATKEMVELVRIKELKQQVVAGFIYFYDFEARGLKSNNLYDCRFVLFEQAWLKREEVKEYHCRVVPSDKQ